MQRRPAVRVCIPFVAGIVLGRILMDGFDPMLLLAGISLLVMLSFLALSFSHALASLLIFIVLVLTGAFLFITDVTGNVQRSVSRWASRAGTEVSISGTILERGYVRTRSVSFVIVVESLFTSTDTSAVVGKVRVLATTSSSAHSFYKRCVPGSRVRIAGLLRIPLPPRNPGEFDGATYLRLQGVSATLSARQESIAVSGDPSRPWSPGDEIGTLREWIGNTFDGLFSADVSALMKGFVIGERTELSEEVRTAFTNSGLMHLLAVSGFNVGLVALLLHAVLRALRCGRISTLIGTSCGLLCFMMLTGSQASVVRATVMVVLFMGARLVERKPDLFNVVAASALVMLMADAPVVFDIGFQLSYAAVLGLAVVYPRLSVFDARVPAWPAFRALIKYVWSSIAVSVAASAGTMPLTALYFNQVSLIGIIVNIVAVPLSGILLALGFAVAVCAAVSSWLSSVYAAVADLLCQGLLAITIWSGSLEHASIACSLSTAGALIVYAALALLCNIHTRKAKIGLLVLCLCCLNWWMYSDLFGSRGFTVRITVLDVGQGDAIIVELPNGQVAGIDAGPSNPSFDSGDRIIAPFLARAGIHRISHFLITHMHNDHAGGVRSLLRRHLVERVIVAASSCSLSVTKKIIATADSAGARIVLLKGATTVDSLDNVRWYVLSSHAGLRVGERGRRNLNNTSVVVKLVYGKTSALLMGDAESEVEEMLLKHYGSFLGSDVLKVAHHGSETSSTEAFLSQVAPQTALISVGARNKFNHPAPVILQRLKVLGIRAFRTDQRGAIVLESDGEKWTIVEWR